MRFQINNPLAFCKEMSSHPITSWQLCHFLPKEIHKSKSQLFPDSSLMRENKKGEIWQWLFGVVPLHTAGSEGSSLLSSAQMANTPPAQDSCHGRNQPFLAEVRAQHGAKGGLATDTAHSVLCWMEPSPPPERKMWQIQSKGAAKRQVCVSPSLFSQKKTNPKNWFRFHWDWRLLSNLWNTN